jgi:hypothetical protein
MRTLIAIAVAAGILTTAEAQVTPQMFAPTPFGVAMTVGQWLLSGTKRVYYIEVRGQGSTAEEARMNGFRLAVEQALGSVIASETEQRNSRIRRDEVISYAAGFVERFEIVNTVSTGSGYEIAMRVWIQRTNLAERLLVTSRADGQIDGARATIAIDTAQYSRSQGDRILGTVLRDFPERSFDVKLQQTRVEMNAGRGTEVVIPYELVWNKRYVDSYYSARKSVSTCGWNGCVMDTPTMNLLYDEIVGSRPHVSVTVNGIDGTLLHRSCIPLTEYSVTDDRFINTAMPRRYTYTIPVSPRDLADMSQVEIRVVRASNCPNYVTVHHKY